MSTTDLGKKPEELIEMLVQAITGFELQELPQSSQQQVVQRCTDMFVSYIINYVQTTHGTKAANKLKGIAIYDTPEIFDKNPELEPMFNEAFSAFVTNIK